MTDVAEKTNTHSSFIQSVNGSIASIALEKTGRAVAGALVTPATWTLNYSVNGTKPDKADLGIYATGLAGGAAIPASIAVGIFKAVADDDIAIKLGLVRKKQDVKYRPFILLSVLIKPTSNQRNDNCKFWWHSMAGCKWPLGLYHRCDWQACI